MNVNSKAFAQPKMTKRQRKLMKGPNAMVRSSTASGQKIGKYIGKPPQFGKINEGGVEKIVKVANGIPFVNPENFGATA